MAMGKISVLLLLAVAAFQNGSLAGKDSFSANQAVDTILHHLSQAVAQNSQIWLRDLKANFTTAVSLLNVSIMETDGVFVATEGNVSTSSSYERIGDAILKKDGKTYELSADFGQYQFAVVYDNYNVSSEGVYQKGKINARTTNNTFKLQVEVKRQRQSYFQWSTTCTATLTGLASTVGSYKMEISNLRIFENLEKNISVLVEHEIRRYTNEILSTYSKEAVQAAKLCETLNVK